jgi:hypothetical protein
MPACFTDIYGQSERILGGFQKRWAGEGNPPVEIFTKWVPNIFQQRVTPALAEASVARSLQALQVWPPFSPSQCFCWLAIQAAALPLHGFLHAAQDGGFPGCCQG